MSLEPPVNERELTAEEKEARVRARADAEASRSLRPHVQAHSDVYRDAMQRFEVAFESLLDTVDVDLEASTRWTALWKLAARSISLTQAMLALTEAGFGVEAHPLGRAIFEANRHIELFLYKRDDADRLLRRWLSGHPLKAVSIRNVNTSVRKEVLGESPHQEEERLYGVLSESGHNKRASVDETVLVGQRRVHIGVLDNWNQRAHFVTWSGLVAEETVMYVGRVLHQFFYKAGMTYEEAVGPTLNRFEHVRREHQLEEPEPDDVQ